jgi:CO/xanthine dehydrogenase FAD-binding subunit
LKPAPFDYHRVRSLEEAFALLDQYGDEARLLAGGQSLVPMLNLRIGRFGHLVDLNWLQNLAFVEETDARITIGALTRHARLESAPPPVHKGCPILAAAAHNIGHVAIRERGTLGGSLALADPAAELPLMATLLNAELELASSSGTRTVRAREFFITVLTTALEPNEVLTRASFPALGPREGWGLRWLSRRIGDFALVNAAATVSLDTDGRIERLRLALGGTGPTPEALADLEAGQRGAVPDRDWPDAVAAGAAERVEPHSDPHASAAYRRDLVRVLLARALRDALGRAGVEG